MVMRLRNKGTMLQVIEGGGMPMYRGGGGFKNFGTLSKSQQAAVKKKGSNVVSMPAAKKARAEAEQQAARRAKMEHKRRVDEYTPSSKAEADFLANKIASLPPVPASKVARFPVNHSRIPTFHPSTVRAAVRRSPDVRSLEAARARKQQAARRANKTPDEKYYEAMAKQAQKGPLAGTGPGPKNFDMKRVMETELPPMTPAGFKQNMGSPGPTPLEKILSSRNEANKMARHHEMMAVPPFSPAVTNGMANALRSNNQAMTTLESLLLRFPHLAPFGVPR